MEIGGFDERQVRNARDARVAAALAQGALLFLFLGVQRVEKALAMRQPLGPLGWVLLLLPELGAVLLLESPWLLAAGVRSRLGRAVWWGGLVLVHAAAYALAIVEHAFFLETGSRLHADLALYALDHLRTLAALIATGIDTGFLARLVLAALSLGLGLSLARRWSPRLSPLVLVLAIVAGGLLTALPALSRETPASALVDFFHVRPRIDPALAAGLPPPPPIYEAPRLTTTSPAAAPTPTAGARRPNVVLLILESTRADVVEPWAAPDFAGHTPALSAIARQSLVFDDVYASVTHTSKALVGILCGMYPRLAMPIDESLEGNLPLACLPHLLGELGYRTAFMQTAWGQFENRPGLLRNLGYQDIAVQETLARPGFEKIGYFGMDEFAMLEPALQWVDGAGGRPFFLTLLTVVAHHPYVVPSSAARPGTEPYLAAIAHQDRFAGELLRGLEQRGRFDDTLLIVLGDHGEAFGEHLRLQHDAVPYEEGVKVPLLIHGPAWLGPPRRAGGLRHQVDLLPTLLEVLGVPWEGRLPGRSLLTTAGHERVFSSCWYTDYCVGMRHGTTKVVSHYNRQPLEVFDLARDPGERQDLAPSITAAELAAAEREVVQWKRSVDAFWARHPAQSGPADWWAPRRSEGGEGVRGR